MTEQWVQIYSNQKEINYISHSNIYRASAETRPPKLHNFLQFSSPPPPSIPDILCRVKFIKILYILLKFYTLVKKGIQSTMTWKKVRIFKNQNNFLTLKLSTVYFEAALFVSVVFIKLKEVVGSKLRAFSFFIEE